MKAATYSSSQAFFLQSARNHEGRLMASIQAKDKYYLRSLHQEIGLYDRKLAHLLKYGPFASNKERDAAAGKLNSKRELLVRNARQLASEGVEYKACELPRSLRSPEQLANEELIQPSEEPSPLHTVN